MDYASLPSLRTGPGFAQTAGAAVDQRRSTRRRGQSRCYREPSLRLPTKASIRPLSSAAPLLQRSGWDAENAPRSVAHGAVLSFPIVSWRLAPRYRSSLGAGSRAYRRTSTQCARRQWRHPHMPGPVVHGHTGIWALEYGGTPAVVQRVLMSVSTSCWHAGREASGDPPNRNRKEGVPAVTGFSLGLRVEREGNEPNFRAAPDCH